MTAVTDLTSRRLEAILSAEQCRARLPSLVAGVVRDGTLVWRGSRGAHTGGPAPGVDVQYRIGSITKTMTAVLVMQLRDEGLLSLGDPLERHLPGIGYGDRTLRSLLAHSSGMQSEPAGPWWERSPGVAFTELADAVDGDAAVFETGATFHYSNLAYGVLGEVVARLRGTTWWEQVEHRILRPLGMKRTTYHPRPPLATGYSVHHFAGTLTEEPAQDTGAMAPAGQVWSTVADLATYAVFLAAGDERVLPADTLLEMCTPQSGAVGAGVASGYGLGLRLVAGGSGTLHGHTGSMPGFLAGLLVDRPRATAAVCLANGTSGLRCDGLPRDLLEELERDEPSLARPWTPVQEVPAAVAELLGVWHWGNTALSFSYDGREVVVAALATGEETFRLAPRADGAFRGTSGYHHGETLRVLRDDEARAHHLVCATFVYTRAPYDPSAPIPGGTPGPG